MKTCAAVLLACAAAAPSIAAAQAPRVVWKLDTDPAFDPMTNGVDLVDDGATQGDAAAGDGIWTAQLSFPAAAGARTYQYLVIPPGGDLSSALGARGGAPMPLAFPDGNAYTVTVRYATALDPSESTDAACPDPATVLACRGFAPIPAIWDDYNTAGATWTAAGSFQPRFGEAAFDASSARMRMVDDGSRGDRVAGDGTYTVTLLSPAGFGGAERWQVAGAADWSLKLGPDGWGFDGVESPWSGYALSSPRWHYVRFELKADRGMARQVADPQGLVLPLLSEIATDPTAPFIEVQNPGPVPLALEGLFLSDDPRYAQQGGMPVAVDPGDFAVGFPAGTVLRAGGYLSVSLVDAATFTAAYGVAPDLEVASMVPAYGAVTSVDGPALDPAGEFVVLYALLPGDELVADVDLVIWGSPAPTDAPADKSGVTVGTSTYGTDAGTGTFAPAGTFIARRDPSEPGETEAAGANGVLDAARGTRDDETTEDLATSWAVAPAPTPGAPPDAFQFTVRGTVTDSATSMPLGGAVIAAQPGGASATSAMDGSYALTLPGGTYTLTASRMGYAPATASNLVVDGDLVQDFALDPLPTVRISGRVESEATGKAIEGARVRLERMGTNLAEVTTNANGQFTLTDVEPDQDYDLLVIATGYYNKRVPVPVADMDVTGLLISLRPRPAGFDVSGRVYDATTDAPIAGATVEIQDEGALVTTGADGTFRFTLIPNGTHTVAAGAPGYEATEVQIEVMNGPVSDVAIGLAPGGQALVLSGKVTVAGLEDLPIAGATLKLTDANGTARLTESDQLGDYVFSGLPAGRYGITVSAQGWRPVSETLDLSTSTQRDFALERAEGAGFVLEGVVQLEGREDWGGSTVEIVEGPKLGRATTDGEGKYRFEDNPPGIYRIRASHPGYVPASTVVTLTSNQSQGFILTLDQTAQTRGCEGGCGGSGGSPAALFLLGAGSVGLLRRRRRP